MNNKPEHSYRLLYRLIPVVFFLCHASFTLLSQKKTESIYAKKLTVNFSEKEINYEESTSITNVLRVINNTNLQSATITIQVISPAGWKSLQTANKEIVINKGDSVFIPIRLIPGKKKIRGGASYSIKTFITDKQSGQLFSASFFAVRKHVNKITMDIDPARKVYLLNNETKANFNITLSNESDDDERVMVTLKKSSRDVAVTDSAGKFLQKEYIQIPLRPNADTTIPFKLQLLNSMRNQRRVDNYNYSLKTPISFNTSIYIQATKPSGIKNNIDSTKNSENFQIGKSIKFVKLNNSLRANQYGSNCLPVTLISNIGFFSTQPIINNVLFGNYTIDSISFVSYNLQASYAGHNFTGNTFKTLNGNLAYASNSIGFQIGNSVSLNMPYVRMRGSGGNGIAATYQIKPNHKLGFAFTKPPIYSSVRGYNLTLGYSGQYKKYFYGVGYNFKNANTLKVTSYSAGLNFKLTQNQTFNVQLGMDDFKNDFIHAYSQYLSSGYQIMYLNQKANSNIIATYIRSPYNFNNKLTSKDSTLFNKIINLGIQNRIPIYKNKYILNTQHSFNGSNSFDPANNPAKRNLYTNSFIFSSTKTKTMSYLPGIIINYSNNLNQKLFSPGAQLGINNSDFTKNRRIGATFFASYNKLLNYTATPAFLTSRINVFATYRVWNCFINHQFGPYTQGDVLQALNTDKPYYQAVNFRLNNQYQFKNAHFLLENNFVYSFVNSNNRNSFNLYSQLFYYSKNGWRLDLNVNWGYVIAESFKYAYLPGVVNTNVMETSPTKQSQSNLVIGLGLKKDFCIPLPKKYVKMKYCDLKVKSFIDVNGNLKFDPHDLPIENVVIALNQHETQSDKLGEVDFNNLDKGIYKLTVTPIEDIGAWFPVFKDSVAVFNTDTLFIPFVQGVEVFGDVEIERDKFSSDMKGALDVSRIRIVLTDSAGNNQTTITDLKGSFKFYVPHNKYTLKFDESILGKDLDLTENDIEVNLEDGVDSYYYTFHVIEKRKTVTSKKFNSAGEQIPLPSPDDISKKYKLRYLDSLTLILNKNLAKPLDNINVINAIQNQVKDLSVELNVGFTLQVDVLTKGQFPDAPLRQLIRLNQVDSIQNSDGSKEYYSGFYATIEDAQKVANQLRNKGLKKSIIKTKQNK